jgi:hypothetical protein
MEAAVAAPLATETTAFCAVLGACADGDVENVEIWLFPQPALE